MVIKSSKGQYIFSSMEKLEQSHLFQTEPFSPVFYLDVIYLVVVVRNIQMHLNTLESLLKLEPGLLTPQEFHTEFL